MKRRHFLVGLLLFCLVEGTLGQQRYNHFLTQSEMEADIDILKFQLERVHAGLYEYCSKKTLDSAFFELRKGLKDSMTDLDFYRALAPLQKIIKNGHTMVIPSEKWSRYKTEQLALFPFDIYWVDDHLYVLKNLSADKTIKDGAEILTINEVPVKEVVEKLMDNITRDGFNTTYPLHLMNLGFEHWYADIIGTPRYFTLKIKSPLNGEISSKNVQALKENQMNSNHLKRYGTKRVAWFLRSDDEKISFKINGDTAILRIPSFDSDTKSETGEKYCRFYRKVFSQLKSATIGHLILDIRNNGGGDPRPQLSLLSYLLDEPIQLYTCTFTIMDEVPDPGYYPNDKVKRLNRLAKLILEKKDSIFEVRNTIFTRMEGGPPKNPVKPKKDRFTGKLYVLIDGGSFSATGETAGILDDRNRAVFIGEEAGGSNYQNTSGRMPMLYLPHSGVRIRMPLIAFRLNVKDLNDGYGVVPDYEVRNTIDQQLNGEDAALQFALNHIAENKH